MSTGTSFSLTGSDSEKFWSAGEKHVVNIVRQAAPVKIIQWLYHQLLMFFYFWSILESLIIIFKI